MNERHFVKMVKSFTGLMASLHIFSKQTFLLKSRRHNTHTGLSSSPVTSFILADLCWSHYLRLSFFLFLLHVCSVCPRVCPITVSWHTTCRRGSTTATYCCRCAIKLCFGVRNTPLVVQRHTQTAEQTNSQKSQML